MFNNFSILNKSIDTLKKISLYVLFAVTILTSLCITSCGAPEEFAADKIGGAYNDYTDAGKKVNEKFSDVREDLAKDSKQATGLAQDALAKARKAKLAIEGKEMDKFEENRKFLDDFCSDDEKYNKLFENKEENKDVIEYCNEHTF